MGEQGIKSTHDLLTVVVASKVADKVVTSVCNFCSQTLYYEADWQKVSRKKACFSRSLLCGHNYCTSCFSLFYDYPANFECLNCRRLITKGIRTTNNKDYRRQLLVRFMNIGVSVCAVVALWYVWPSAFDDTTRHMYDNEEDTSD
jgi:hypothetical protein